MTWRTLLRQHGRRVAAVLVLTVLGGLGGLVTALTATPRYDAVATVLVTVRATGTPYDALAGSLYATSRITSYAAVAQTPVVLDPVVDELGLTVSAAQLARRVRAQVDANGLTIDLICSGPSAAGARELANAVATSLAGVVENQLEADSTSTGSVVGVTTVRPAVRPSAPAFPVPLTSVGTGVLAGLVFGVGVALLGGSLRAREVAR